MLCFDKKKTVHTGRYIYTCLDLLIHVHVPIPIGLNQS